MAIKISRHPELNLNKCVDMVGGNKYELVLIAAARAREMQKSQSGSAALTALLEVQDGKIGREYMAKVGK